MERSSKQQAAASKQPATSSVCPRAGPRATRVPKWKTNVTYPGWFSATFVHFTFWLTEPPRVGKHEMQWGFRLFRPRAENKKIQFPGARGIFGGKYGRQNSVPESWQHFFTFCVLADWTPTAGTIAYSGMSGMFRNIQNIPEYSRIFRTNQQSGVPSHPPPLATCSAKVSWIPHGFSTLKILQPHGHVCGDLPPVHPRC